MYQLRRIAYKGWVIHPRKVSLMPLYFAWVYSADIDTPGFKVKRDGNGRPIETRERVVELAKREIDSRLNAHRVTPPSVPSGRE